MTPPESSQHPERRSSVRPPSGSSAIRKRLEQLQLVDEGVSLRGPDSGTDAPPEEKGEERYLLRGEIARGGMGAILKVWDADLRRNIAMKLLLDKHFKERAGARSVDPLVLSRFLEEAQVTGQLDHPGVVPVHELGIEPDGRIYFTMRLVRGRDYEHVIDLAREGKEGWNRTRALGTLQRVCETMAYAHSKGVVHRDLKPANVMVGQFGETYVMDWGLAKIVGRPDRLAQEQSDKISTIGLSSILTDRRQRAREGTPSPLDTQQGAVIGTPYYMPPEQAAGKIDEVGPHSDVYAVGCMLYQLLTGRRPYEQPGGHVDVHTLLAMVMHSPPPRILDLDRTAPLELVAICEHAMATDWRARYPSMLEMAVDLRAYLEGRVVSAHETGALAGLKKWVLRHKGLSSSLAGLVLLAIGSAGGFAWLERQRYLAVSAEQARTAAAQHDAEANLLLATERAEDLRHQSYATNVMAADVSLRAGEVREAKRYLNESPSDLRGWEWHHIASRADAALAVLTGHKAAVSCLAVDRAGRLAVSGGEDGTARVWDLDSGSAVYAPLAAHESAVLFVAFSANGQGIITFGGPANANMRQWDARTGALVTDRALADYAVHSIALAPDGELVAFGTADGSIKLLSARTGLERESIAAHERLVSALSFSPDGTQLLSGSSDGTLVLRSLADKRTVWSAPPLSAPVHSVAFDDSGMRIAVGFEGGLVIELAAQDGGLIRELKGHEGDVDALAYDHEGRLASGASDKTVRLWSPAQPEPLAVLLGHDQPVRAVAFAGGLVLSGSEDTTVRTVDPLASGRDSEWVGPDDYVSALAFAPDGARLVAGTAFMGSLALLDGASAAPLRSFPGCDDLIRTLAFQPDGKGFAYATEQDPKVHRIDLTSESVPADFVGHTLSVTSLAFSSDGQRLASGSKERAVRIFEVASGRELARFEQHTGGVQGVAFAPDGTRVASVDSAGGAYVWDARTAELVATLAKPAAADDTGGAALNAVAFAPGGEVVAIGGADRIARLCDARTGKLVREFRGHDHTVSALTFLGADRLVTGSYDGTVRVWDAQNARLLLVLRVGAFITAVSVTADGTRIAASAFDNTVRIWHAAQPR